MEDQEKKEDKTTPPDPPLDPIIETPDQEEDTSMNMGEPIEGHSGEGWWSTRNWGFSRRLTQRSTKQTCGVEATSTGASSNYESSRKTKTKGGSDAQGLHARHPTSDA